MTKLIRVLRGFRNPKRGIWLEEHCIFNIKSEYLPKSNKTIQSITRYDGIIIRMNKYISHYGRFPQTGVSCVLFPRRVWSTECHSNQINSTYSYCIVFIFYRHKNQHPFAMSSKTLQSFLGSSCFAPLTLSTVYTDSQYNDILTLISLYHCQCLPID